MARKDSQETPVVEDAPAVDTTELIFEGPASGEAGELKVEAIDTKTNRKAIIYKNFGTDLADAVAKTSEAVIYSNYVAQSKIRCQALMRSRLSKGLPMDDMLAWMPGVAMERVVRTTQESAILMFDKLSPEEKVAMIAKLQEKL